MEKIINFIYKILCWMDNVRSFPFKDFPEVYYIDRERKQIINLKPKKNETPHNVQRKGKLST